MCIAKNIRMIISIQELQRNYSVSPKGIIHVGAHLLEERQSYLDVGPKKILWVEGNPALACRIREIIESSRTPFCDEKFASQLIDVVSGKKVSFHLAQNTQVSSLLEFGLHSEEWPDIVHGPVVDLETQRLEKIIEATGLACDQIDFLNVDVQGVELRVIRSLGKHLKNIQWIYTEINVRDTYLGCDKLWMIDSYLVFRGFRRRELKFATRGWGDAFYARVNSGGFLQGLLPWFQYMAQNVFFVVGNLLRPLLGMR